jgi:hypothetical protein
MRKPDQALEEIVSIGQFLTTEEYVDYLTEVLDEVSILLDAAKGDLELEDDEED